MTEEKNTNSAVLPTIISVCFIIFAFVRIADRLSDRSESRQEFKEMFNVPQPDLSAYKSIKQSEYGKETDEIVSVWNKLNNKKIKGEEKLDLVTNAFTREVARRFESAYYDSEETLQNLTPIKRLETYATRSELLDLLTPKEIKEKDATEFRGLYFYVVISSMKFPKLNKIKYVSEKHAYGIYEVFGNNKSVEFKKEDNLWQANIYNEDPIFDESRKLLMEKRIATVGSERGYLVTLFQAKTGVFRPLK